jgi:tetratricopeptide (TPR) repeat protein
MDREEYWRFYLAFIAAVCIDIRDDTNHVRFRRHTLVHLPPNKRLLNGTSGVEEEGLWWMWSCVGRVLQQEGKWKEAEKLFLQVIEARRRVIGAEHPDTLRAVGNLAATYRKQGRKEEAEELQVMVLKARRRVLGEEHPDTLFAMAYLAYTKRALGQNKLALDLIAQSATASSRVLGYNHPDCRTRHRKAVLWSSVTRNDDRECDQDSNQDIDQPFYSDEDGGVTVW